MASLGKGILGALGQIVSLLSGGVAGALRLVNNLVFSGFKMAFQFNDSAMAFSRQAGLTAKQAQAYTEVLATRAKNLGEKYGIAAEEVAKLERNLARATGRVIMLNDAQADMQVAINRTVGEDTANEFMQSIVRTMGGQLGTAQGAVTKAYAMAAKKGLDAAGMAAKVGQNLAMANRLTFKNGVDGLTKMVALSEKLGFNVQSLESAANSFMDLQDAIENSARLTMLGGAAGAFGGNPLDMTYEANYDPEAFGERMTKMLGGYAQFDEKTGMARMNAMSRDFVKGIADAMHISLDEASAIAKKQAEIRYKNDRFGNQITGLAGNDENKRDYILNKAQYNAQTGQLEINGKELSYYQKGEGAKQLEEMMRFNNMTDEEIVREQASAVVSIKDRMEGYMTTISGMMAENILPFMPKIQEFLGDIFNIFKPHVGDIANNIKKLLTTMFEPENIALIKNGMKAAIEMFSWLAKFLTSSWKTLLGAAFFGVLTGWLARIVTAISTTFGGGRGSIGTGAKAGLKSRSYKQVKNDMKLGRKPGNSWWKNNRSSYRSLMRNSRAARGVAKGLGWAGTALAIGEAGYSLYDNYRRREEIENDTSKSQRQKEKEKQKVNHETSEAIGGAAGALAGGLAGAKIGAMAGSLGGPIGAGVGAAIGSIIGGFAGYAGGEWVGGKVIPESHAFGGAVGGKMTPAGKAIFTLSESKVEPNYASGKNTNNRDTILTGLAERELVINPQQQETLVSNIVAKPVGEKTIVYVPQNTQSTVAGNSTLTVNDINVKFSGTLRLDGGSAYRDIDIKEILDDPTVRAYIANMVRNEFSSNTYMKEMHDTRFAMGYSDPSGIVGRMRNG